MAVAEAFRLRATDGVEIACRRWLPDAAPVAIVQIAHGLAEHCARYDRLAVELVGAGYAVYSHDHRGHGDTVSSPDDLGHYDGWTTVVGDVLHVGREARRAHPGRALILLGHSMGSFVTQQIIASEPQSYDGYVLSGSNAPGGLTSRIATWIARVERRRLGPRAKSALLASLSFGSFNRGFGPKDGFEWLSRDPDEVLAYVRDPRCGFACTTQLWITLFGGLVSIARADLTRLPRDLPIYLFAGARDPVGNRGKGVLKLARRYERAGLTSVRVKLYPDGRHEMLNEVNRAEVVADLRAWLGTHVSTVRSAATA